MPFLVTIAGMVAGLTMILFPAPWIKFHMKNSRTRFGRSIWRESTDMGMRIVGVGYLLFFLLMFFAFLHGETH